MKFFSLPSNPLRQDKEIFYEHESKKVFPIVWVKVINQFDSISYLFDDRFDDSEKFEPKLSVDVSRIDTSSKSSSMM